MTTGKKWKRRTPVEIAKKLEDADRLLNAGKSLGEVLQVLDVSEATYHRWRNQNNASLTVIGSTIATNSAGGNGGGITNFVAGALTISGSTRRQCGRHEWRRAKRVAGRAPPGESGLLTY